METRNVDVLALQVDNLHYQYPDGAKALCGASLHVAHGEAVGLVGPNGAGKTSLFACLAGVLRPDQGQVVVCGLNVAEPTQRRQLPHKLGIVFQDSDDQLFHPSVLDEVAFGPLNLGLAEAEARRRVTTALHYVGLQGMEARVPYHLSGGEKKRVALASVLAMQPEVLLLDEPSSFLDPRGRRELIALVKQLPVAKLIASHDLEFIVATCQRVLLFDGGSVVAEGKLRDVLTDRQLMEKHGLEVPHSLTHPHPHA